MSLSVKQFTAIVQGSNLGSGEGTIETIVFDSRRIRQTQNALFIAFVTKGNDGHKYLESAYNSGIRLFLVHEVPKTDWAAKAQFIIVPDTLRAWQKVAQEIRKEYAGPMLAITGSNGKTIVKEWVSTLLANFGKVAKTPGSYNSQIGVPFSLWALRPDHEYAIFEAGISEPNEMVFLRDMLRPTVGLITNIGSAHDAFFENREQKLKEKLALFDGCPRLIYRRDNSLVHNGILSHPWTQKPELFSWGSEPTNDLVLISEQSSDHGYRQLWFFNDISFKTEIPFRDAASRENAGHALAVALSLGIEPKALKEHFSALPEIEMRVQINRGIKGCTLINDFYNSDWESIQNALDLLSEQKQHDQHSLILSDLVQNSFEEAVYQQTANRLSKDSWKNAFFVGPHWPKYKSQLPANALFFETTEELIKASQVFNFEKEAILIKGARAFALEKMARILSLREHPTQLEIDLKSLAHNYKYFRSIIRPETRLMVMVKAFSYGTGGYEIANVLRFNGANYLAVAYPDEGVELRNAGINLPILVLNSEERNFDILLRFCLEPEIYSLNQLKRFIAAANAQDLTDYPIHLKLDTGMHRLGFMENELEGLIQLLKGTKAVRVTSVFTHLAASDNEEERDFTLSQIERYKGLTARLKSGLGYSFTQHVLNSSGITHFPEAQFDMVRLGIGLYGISSQIEEQERLQLVGRWVSEVAQIKTVKKGSTIGYGRSYKAEQDMRIAVVSLGYADGLSRSLSNGTGQLYWRGHALPIVGRVCMDMTMVSIGDLDIQEGDEIVVFETPEQLKKLAEAMQTITYEVLTSISNRVRRVYLQE